METPIENEDQDEDLLDDATKYLPFRIKERKLKGEEISVRIKASSKNIKKCFRETSTKSFDIVYKFAEVKNKTNWITRILISISIVSILAHIGVQGVIVKEYFDTDNKRVMIGSLCITCLFLVINFCLFCPCSCLIDKLDLRVGLYTLLLLVYVVIFCFEAHFLMTNDFNYFLASLILFLLSVNVPGFLVIGSFLIDPAYYVAYLFFMPVLYLNLKCCYNPREDEGVRNIYYYDPTKTSKKACTECKVDFEKSDEICICRAHRLHIFHERCISGWLSRKSYCPLCANNQPAKFY